MKISDYVESQIKGLWGTDFDENGIPVIKTNNLTYEGHIDYSDICKRNITKEQAKECYLKPGDLLIEKSGGTKTHSVGYVSYFEGDENKFVCNNFILALRPKNTINSKFLFYQIQFKYESNQFSDCFNKTTGIQNLKVKDYLAKEIKIYTPEEQEKIVSELDTVRSIINKNKQILEKYEILIKSRFIEMFGDPVQNPMNWMTGYMKDITIKITDGEHGTVPRCEDEGFLYLMARNVTQQNSLDLSEISYIPEEYHKKIYKRCNPEKGDLILVCVGATVGKSCLIPEMKEFSMARSLALLKPDYTKINSDFLLYLVSSFYIQNQIQNCVHAAAQAGLYTNMINKLKVYIPPISLQNNFASFVQQIDKSKFEYAYTGVAA